MKQPSMAAYREQCRALAEGDPPRRAEVLEIWIDHGSRPDNAACAYLVCMRPEQAPLPEWLKRPPVEILANTPGLQAVRDLRAGVTHAFFHVAGDLKDRNGRLIAGAAEPAAVMMRGAPGGGWELSVQDPLAACTGDLNAMSGALHLTLPGGVTTTVPMPGAGDPDDRYRGGVARVRIGAAKAPAAATPAATP